MKMVSAAKLRRAQERALAARPYAQMLTNVLKSLVARAEIYDPETGEPSILCWRSARKRTFFLIVVTGDKGLAGAFNTNILKAAKRFSIRRRVRISTSRPSAARGAISCEALSGRQSANAKLGGLAESIETEQDRRSAQGEIQITGEHVGVLGKVEFAQASARWPSNVIDRYTREEIDAVYIVLQRVQVGHRAALDCREILPIEADRRAGDPPGRRADRGRAEESARSRNQRRRRHAPARDTERDRRGSAKFGTAQVDYIYEQPPEELFRALLPKYVSIQIFHALLESVAAEHAARMTAMDSATNNATDMIDSLTLVMNRVRQAKITKEIIEIVSGAAAM